MTPAQSLNDVVEPSTGGSHRYIDRLLLGVDHLYDEPTCMEAYQWYVRSLKARVPPEW